MKSTKPRRVAGASKRPGKIESTMTKAEAAAFRRDGIQNGDATVRCVAFLTPDEVKRMHANRWLGCIAGLEGNQTLARGRALRLALQCFLKGQEAGS